MSEEQLSLDEIGEKTDATEDAFNLVRIGPRELKLPTEWDVRDLDPEEGVTNRITDGAHHSPNQSDSGEYYYATVSNMSPKGIDYETCNLISEQEYEKMVAGDCKPKKGEVLFSKDGTVGLTSVFDGQEDVVLLSSIAIIDPDTDYLNSKFLSQYLSSWHTDFQIQSLKSGTAIRRVVLVDLEKLSVPLPPLPEQRKIATVLDTVDRVIEKTETIIDQAKKVRNGLRQCAFEYGLDETGEFRNLTDDMLEKTRIGNIPQAWDFLSLDQVCSDVVDCLNTTPEYSDSGIRVILTSEIENGRYDPESSPYVSEEVYQERIRRIKPQPGDVIFTREAPIGEAFKIPEGERLCLGQRTMQIRPEDDALDSDFLLELLYSEKMQGWFQRVAVGSTTKHMRVGDVEKMKIPVPSIEEQRRIASLLGSYRDYIENNMCYTNQLRRLKRGLMQDLLSGTVRTTDTNIQVPDEIAQHG